MRFDHTTIFFKLTDYYKISDIHINHNICLGQILIKYLIKTVLTRCVMMR